MSDGEDLLGPHERNDWVGDQALEAQVRRYIDDGAFSHGWLLTGAEGLGKSVFAYRAARALLAGPEALVEEGSLGVAADNKIARLVAQRAHPDLFIAERRWDDKKGRFETEITVDTIRKLIEFLNRTASFGGWRVAIINAADELNRNAANALLKALEEPPKNALLLMVCHAPGRLIATIRSRCRRLDFRPVGQEVVQDFLRREGVSEDVARIAEASRGRPGYALGLAKGEGGEAVAALEDFLAALTARGSVAQVAQSLTGKAGDARWEVFAPLLLEAVSDAARASAAGDPVSGPFANVAPAQLVAAFEQLSTFLTRGEAVNLDRSQMIGAMHRSLMRALDLKIA